MPRSNVDKIAAAFLSLYLAACAHPHNPKVSNINPPPSDLETSCEVQGERLANFVKRNGNTGSLEFQARDIANAYCLADEITQRLELKRGYELVETSNVLGNPTYIVKWGH